MMDTRPEFPDVGKMNIENELASSEEIGLMDLDDFSLGIMVSYLDFKAFNSISRTCKRLKSITDERQSWNNSVLFLRISRLIQNAWFEGWFDEKGKCLKKYPNCNLGNLIKEGLRLGQNLSALSPRNAKFNLKENGPVVFKVLSFLTQFKTEEIHNYPQSTWLIRRKKSTFRLPCGEMMIEVSVIENHNKGNPVDDDDDDDEDDDDDVHEGEDQEGHDDEIYGKIKIKAYLNGKCILIYKTSNYEEPYELVNSDTEDVKISNDPSSLQPIINIITQSLPKITKKLKIDWVMGLLLSFPFKSLNPTNMLYFEEREDNAEPKWDKYFEKLSEKRKNCIEQYDKISQKYIKGIDAEHEDESSKLVHYLSVLLDKKSGFYPYVDHCYHASAKVGFDLLLANEAVVRCLLRRVDFMEYTNQNMFECMINIRLLEGNVLHVKSYLAEETMVDATEIKFQFALNDECICEWKTNGLFQPNQNFSGLSSITRLIQDCVNVDLEKCESDKTLTDKLTAKFFFSLVKGLSKGSTGVFR